MPLVFSKQIPSGLGNGIMIPVVAVASPGTTFHQMQATATDAMEMVYLDAVNTATVDRILNVEFGGTGTEGFFNVSLAANQGINRVVAGWPLTATNSIVRVFATATGGIRVAGFVHRAT